MIANLLDISDEDQRRTFLDDHRADLNLKVIEELKAQADQWLLRDTRRALQIAEVALEAASFLSDSLALALARWAKGNALIYLGKHEACLALYREAMALYAERGLSLEVARLQTNAIFALTNLGRYEEALAQADSARAELERHGPTRYLATLEQNVGIACRHLGRYEQALVAYERAQAIFQALDDPVKVAEMQVNRSKVLENLDDFRQAMALLEKARPVFEVHHQAVTVARTDLNVATLLFRQGRYQEALEAYERARQGFATLGNDVEVAVVDLYRSSVHLALNLFPEALELAIQARRPLAERGMARQVALATARQAAAQRGMGELDEAGRLFEQARDIWVETGAEVEAALLDLERAALWRVQGRPHEACPEGPPELDEGRSRRALLLAEASAEVFNQRGMSVRSAQARLLMAECQADLGRLVEAESLYQAVLEAPFSKELASLAYRAHHGLGRIEERRERREAACRHYQQAVTHIEAMQRDLRVDEFKASFLDDKLEVYQALVHTLLALGRPEEAFEVVERAKSGVLLDFLTSLDLHRLAPPSPPPDLGGMKGGTQELWERLQALKEEWHWHYRKIEGRAAEGD
ncbi:MAG: tetratricopeptide repeat protein, partial [Anaerolineales bacterium]|nr:tetratricopeptide repeat protein [Anaerolineales bacterium]